MNRRLTRTINWSLLASLLLFAATLPKLVLAGESYSLQSQCQKGDLRRVTAKIQVDGILKPSMDPKVPSLPPMNVRGHFVYDELRLDDPADGAVDHPSRRSVRYYREAKARIRIDKQTDSSTLRDDVRLITVRAEGKGKVAISSPRGPLMREELELIDLPFNTLLADRLLPEAKVKIGDSWKIPDEALAGLFGLDAVSHGGIEASLAGVDDSTARIQLAGTIAGAVDGVATEIEIKGTAGFRLKEKCLISIQARIKERRSVGFVSPGFEVTADMDVEMASLAGSDQLTDAVVKEVSVSPAPPAAGQAGDKPAEAELAAQLLLFRSEADGFHFLYHTRRHITRNAPNLVVLRLVDRGELVAQCNISALPKLPTGDSLTAEEFQDEVKKSLGKNFGRIESAEEGTTANGSRLMRVFVSGTVSEMPIAWRYYLLLDAEGRRVAFSFTMESSLADRFAEADATISQSLDFNLVLAKTARREEADSDE